MNLYKLQAQIGIFLLSLSSLSFAGTVHHKIINNTPYELYFGVRQQFQYPIASCLGPIASGETKECEDVFEDLDSKFIEELIKRSEPAEELLVTTLLNRPTYKKISLVWMLKLNKKNEIDVFLQPENKTLKWTNQSIIRK